MNNYYIKQSDKIVAYLVHEPTKSNIAVYKKIGFFQRIMIRECFGLKYKKL